MTDTIAEVALILITPVAGLMIGGLLLYVVRHQR